MQLWKIGYEANEYNILTFVDDRLLTEEKGIYDGRSKIKDWEEISFKRQDSSGVAGTNVFWSVMDMPIVDEKVLNIIQSAVKNEIEILPIKIEDKEYSDKQFFIINVVNKLDCIDFDRSKYKTFADKERIMWFTEYVFKDEVIRNQDIFIAEGDATLRSVYISNTLKELLENEDIKGFIFELIYDSEKQAEKEAFKQKEIIKRKKNEKIYRNLTKELLFSLPKEDWVGAIMIWLQEKAFYKDNAMMQNVKSLPTPCQHIFSLCLLKCEMENGGYNQFFYNFGSELGRIAKEAFEKLGIEDLALITKDAIETWEDRNHGISAGDEDMKKFMNSIDNPLYASDGYFGGSYSLNKLDELLIQYVEGNMECFGE
jgi:hypothetical protein